MNLKRTIFVMSMLFLSFQYAFSLDIQRNETIEKTMNELRDIKLNKAEFKGNGRELTHLLDYAKKNYNLLSEEQKSILGLYEIIESEFDVTYTTPDNNFIIYFKSVGPDGIEWIDNDESGMVDLVEDYGRYLMYALEKYQASGFRKPYTNEKQFYKVYIASSACGDNVLGYNTTVDLFPTSASGTYTVLRSDYNKFAAGKPAGYGDSVIAQITIAHEFFHAVQRTYSNMNMNMFIMEGGAVWSEQFVYPGELDPINYVQNFLTLSNIGINYDPRTEYNPSGQSKGGIYYLYPYGSWSFYKYLTDIYGNEFIKELYEQLADNEEVKSFNNALAKYNSSYAEVVKDFYATCITFNNDESKKPHYFSMGEHFNLTGAGSFYSPRIFPTIAKRLNDLDEITVGNKTDISDPNRAILNRLATHYIRFNDKLSGKYKLVPFSKSDQLALLVCQYKTRATPNSGTNFRIYEAKAFGNPAELDIPHNNEYDNTIIMVYNYSTRNTPSKTGWNEGVNSAYYSLTFTANKNSVEDNIFTSSNSFNLVKIYPAPATNKITLQFNSILAEDLKINIYNNLGRLLESNDYYSTSGENYFNLNLESYSAGSYVLEVKNNNKTERMNFIKQ